ncbi:MAG: 2-dehydropantoate 2-reductase [Syntrophobacteraceae bacterium]
MKIGIMGTGGIGGYFGGLLARAGLDTHFLARGKHLRAIVEDGLQIVSNQKSFRVMIHATAEPDEIGPVDLLLFCVKSYDTLEAASLIEPMVEAETMILSLQNGIDNIDKLVDMYGEDRVLAGTTFIQSYIGSPGVVVHVGKAGRLVFGELSGVRTKRVAKVLEAFQRANIEAEASADILKALWSKFLFICGIHGVGTLSRSPLGLVMSCPETRELVTGVMKEVEALARKRGIDLPNGSVVEAMAMADAYDRDFKCSMLRDLEWHRPMEIDALNGMVVKMSRDAGLDAPFNQTIYSCLKLENEKIMNPFWASGHLDGVVEDR